MAEFNLGKLYTSLASYKGLPFPIGIDQLPAYKLQQFKDRLKWGADTPDIPDIYGQPVIMPVWIGLTILGTGMEGDHLTMQPMVVFEGKKKIVKNGIGGGSYNGTIKEFINFDDYKLTITGAVINQNQKEYPYEQVSIIREKLWKPNRAQEFYSPVTNDLFDHIVVEDIKFKELNMSPGIQMYEIKAISDATLEVEQLKGE